MPAKVLFKFVPGGRNDQALLGNRHRVDVFITKKENVNLKSLKLHFDDIECIDPSNELRTVDLATDQSVMMEAVSMNASMMTQDTT